MEGKCVQGALNLHIVGNLRVGEVVVAKVVGIVVPHLPQRSRLRVGVASLTLGQLFIRRKFAECVSPSSSIARRAGCLMRDKDDCALPYLSLGQGIRQRRRAANDFSKLRRGDKQRAVVATGKRLGRRL